MRGLFDYLDCNGPEFEYLGHFRRPEFLMAGHNWEDSEGETRTDDVFKQDQYVNFRNEMAENDRANQSPGESEDATKGSRVFGSGDDPRVNADKRTRDEMETQIFPGGGQRHL